MCRYDLTETCVSAAKCPSVRPHLEGEMPKTVSIGRNVRGARRPRVWGESSRGETSTCMEQIVQVANRPGGETSRQGAKRRGGKTSSYPDFKVIGVSCHQ